MVPNFFSLKWSCLGTLPSASLKKKKTNKLKHNGWSKFFTREIWIDVDKSVKKIFIYNKKIQIFFFLEIKCLFIKTALTIKLSCRTLLFKGKSCVNGLSTLNFQTNCKILQYYTFYKIDEMIYLFQKKLSYVLIIQWKTITYGYWMFRLRVERSSIFG